MIDAASKLDDVDLVIVTHAHKDHIKELDKYIEDETPIVSSRAVIKRLQAMYDYDNFYAPEEKMKIENTQILLFKVQHADKEPCIGIAIRSPSTKIAIIPEFLQLNQYAKELISGNIIFTGVGNYDEDDTEEGKLSFKSLLSLAEELKPKALYLINLRKNLKEQTDKLNEELKRFNGRVINDGETISFKSKETLDGIYLVKPHAELIYQGKKKMVVKSKPFEIAFRKFILLDNTHAYGIISLAPYAMIKDKEEFDKMRDLHCITDEELKAWKWSFPLYGYLIYSFEPFDKPKEVKLPRGIQTFVKDPMNYFVKIKDPKNYNPEEMTNEQLADDIRLLVAYVSRLREEGRW